MILFEFLKRMIALHAGTSPIVSQSILTLMFVVLGTVLIGIGFGFITKSREGLLEHRWVLTASLVLTLGAVFFVMLPTVFSFYIDPDVEVFSSMSIMTIVHGIAGVPALITAIIYAFGDLPAKVKKWMRVTAVFWVLSIAFGVILFLLMMEII